MIWPNDGCVRLYFFKSARLLFPKNRYDVFNLDDKQPIVALEIHRDCPLWIEQDLVVLFERKFTGHLHFCRNGHNPSGDRRDFNIIGKLNPALGLLFIFVFADQNALADRFDCLKCFLIGN